MGYSKCPSCGDYTGCYMAGYCGRCGYTDGCKAKPPCRWHRDQAKKVAKAKAS